MNTETYLEMEETECDIYSDIMAYSKESTAIINVRAILETEERMKELYTTETYIEYKAHRG